MQDVDSSDLEYFHHSDRMIGYFCNPRSAGSKPGILMVHGAFGLTDHIFAQARDLAAHGYAVLAVDLWGERLKLRGPEEFGPVLGKFTSDRRFWMDRLIAAHDALTAQAGVDSGRIGAVGYCFGGASVLEYARNVGGVRGVVSLHAALDAVSTEWSSERSSTRVLISSGADDPLARLPDLAALQTAMSEAGIDWEVNLYGGARHAFTEPDSPSTPPFAGYHALAAHRGWQSAISFFEDVLSPLESLSGSD